MDGVEPIRVAAQGTGLYVGCAINDTMLFNSQDENYFPFHRINFMVTYVRV